MKRSVFLGVLLLYLFCTVSIVYGNTKSNVEKIVSSDGRICITACLNGANDSMLISYSSDDGQQKGVYFYENNKKGKTIPDVSHGTISPNSKYFTYMKNNQLMIFNAKGKLLKKVAIKLNELNMIEKVFWSWDSQSIFVSVQDEGENIYRINPHTGKKEIIFKGDYYSMPVAVNNNNILYLLESKEKGAEPSDCNIVKYDIKTKKFQTVDLSFVKDLYIYDDFTISPNEKIIFVQSKGMTFVIDICKKKIISKFILPGFSFPDLPEIGEYSWKADSSYLVFSCLVSQKYGVYKYTVPQKYLK